MRHEEAAAFAASAEAALTGELAVCAGSCGPGNLHLVNGLYDANRSRVPVLAIAAHIPEVEIGLQYFQETHPQELFREASVYRELVSTPEQVPHVMESAMRAALERGGVAVVVIPGGVSFADAPAGPATPVRKAASVIRPAEAPLAAAAEVLNGASRVAILAGAGCAGAHDQLMEFAGTLQAPVVHAMRGKEFVDVRNRFDVGMTGLIGWASRSANFRIGGPGRSAPSCTGPTGRDGERSTGSWPGPCAAGPPLWPAVRRGGLGLGLRPPPGGRALQADLGVRRQDAGR